MEGSNQVGQFTEQSTSNKGHGNSETCHILCNNKRKTKFLGSQLTGNYKMSVKKNHDLMVQRGLSSSCNFMYHSLPKRVSCNQVAGKEL